MDENKLKLALATLAAEILNLRERVAMLEEKDPELDAEEGLEVILEILDLTKAQMYEVLRRHREK